MEHYHLHLLAILGAAVAAVIVSSVYYMAFARSMATLHPAYADPNAKPAPWMVGVELLRSFVLAHVIAWLAVALDVAGVGEAMLLALVLWLGFPVVLFTGAMVWERVPPRLAAIHLGDWLIKLVVVTVIVALWP